MLHKDLYPDLEPIVRGSTWKKLFDWFHLAGMLRYSTQQHLRNIGKYGLYDGQYKLQDLGKQFGSKQKIKKFIEIGLLTAVNNAYKITDKVIQILKDESFNVRILKQADGEGTGHELAVSSALVKIMREPHFYAAFYYDFGFLRPDSVVIHKKDSAYKITMLEVEQEKPDWLEYLKDKRDKYNKLAQDEEIYSKWWKVYSEKLGFPFCSQDKFCFSVLTNSKIQFEAEGWNWL